MNFRLDENGTKLVWDGPSFADVQPNVAPYEFIGNIVEKYVNGKLTEYVVITQVDIVEDDPTIFVIRIGNGVLYVDNTTGKFYETKEELLAAREAAAAEAEDETNNG